MPVPHCSILLHFHLHLRHVFSFTLINDIAKTMWKLQVSQKHFLVWVHKSIYTFCQSFYSFCTFLQHKYKKNMCTSPSRCARSTLILGIIVSGMRVLSSDKKLEKAFTPDRSLANSSLVFCPISLKHTNQLNQK